jgi:hypothetical protein
MKNTEIIFQKIIAILIIVAFFYYARETKIDVLNNQFAIPIMNGVITILIHMSLVMPMAMSLDVIFGRELGDKYGGKFFTGIMSIFTKHSKSAVKKLNDKVNGE